ncbi:putative exporter of polyketide antibiotics [Zymobacter palmae]|uniref:Putative exporter of polyketide antibiotics n=1 Tax=Zymobacter palmae TaxID=33074 RepID=A0A348HDF1_9GAMM|nr:putative exporter of polyketide antibiotics [Zymobacter palmae]
MKMGHGDQGLPWLTLGYAVFAQLVMKCGGTLGIVEWVLAHL